MTSITLNTQTPATAAQPSIGAALSELMVAGRHFSVALLSTLRRPSAASRRLSVFEEAENLLMRGSEREGKNLLINSIS